MTDPDALPPLDRRARWRLALVPLAVAAVFAASAGWVRLEQADRRRANVLYGLGRAHTDAEFAELLALAAAPDPQARYTAVTTAALDRDPARRERVERAAVPMLDSPDPERRVTGLVALGMAERVALRDRVAGLRGDPEPIVRDQAAWTVRALDTSFVLALSAVERPLTDHEFARAADVCGGDFWGDPPFRLVETAAGRSADHRRAGLALFDRLATAPGDPQRQRAAAESAARLREVP